MIRRYDQKISKNFNHKAKEALRFQSERRLADLEELASHYWSVHGEKFDPDQYWKYGCHCLLRHEGTFNKK